MERSLGCMLKVGEYRVVCLTAFLLCEEMVRSSMFILHVLEGS